MAGAMFSSRSGVCAALAVLLVSGALPVHAQDVAPDSFARLRSETDVNDAAGVRAARLRLEGSDPLFWRIEWPAGPFRSALARSLTPAEAGAQLDQAAAEPEFIVACAANLAGRDDIGALLLAGDRFDVLAAAHVRTVVGIAEDDLYAGRRGLAIRLLSDPERAESAAESFVVGATPDGIRLVADVLSGTIELPAPALAALARARPVNYGPRRPKLLGAERIAALVAAQVKLDDHLLRVLVAQIVELSSDAGVDTIAEAWGHAHSVDADIGDWDRVGRDHSETVTIANLPEATVVHVMRGARFAWRVWAEEGFDDADSAAGWFVASYEGAQDARLRGALVLELRSIHTRFIAGERRKHAVPAWRAFLGKLAAGRESDPPVLRLLGQRIARTLLRDLGHEPSRRWRQQGPLLPRATPDGIGTSATGRALALVAAADDPARLLVQIDTAQLDSHEPDLQALIRPRPTLDADTCVALRKLVERCPDPRGARLAASLLAVGGDLDDMAFVIRRADRLDLDGEYDGYWLPPGERLVITPESLRRVLELLEDTSIAPVARFDLLERILQALVVEDGPRPGALALLRNWIETVAPSLDGGLAEYALAEVRDFAFLNDEWAELAVPVRVGIESMPEGGPQLRLLTPE